MYSWPKSSFSHDGKLLQLLILYVHQKMCHAIITSIIGLNFFHFSSLTSKLTWIFCKIDMKPIVVWRHGFFSRSWDELSMLCMCKCNWLVLYQGRVIVHQIGYMPIQMSFSENCKIKEFMLCLYTMDSTFDKNKMTLPIFRCSVLIKTRIRYLECNLNGF